MTPIYNYILFSSKKKYISKFPRNTFFCPSYYVPEDLFYSSYVAKKISPEVPDLAVEM